MLINGRFYSEPELNQYLNDYARENKRLADKVDELNEVIKRFDDENKELKRLLKLAVEDFKTLVLKSTALCNMKITCNKCPLNCTNDNLGWKKEAEALKLIGGEEDE